MGVGVGADLVDVPAVTAGIGRVAVVRGYIKNCDVVVREWVYVLLWFEGVHLQKGLEHSVHGNMEYCGPRDEQSRQHPFAHR